MPRDPGATRTALLDAARDLVFGAGFSATTVESIIERAGVTKGAFFHHFPSKQDLGQALIVRFAERDADLLDETLSRAEKLSRDPLHQVLLLVGLYAEMLEGRENPPDGCLIASYCYQDEIFEERTREVMRGTIELWRERIGRKLEEAAGIHRPVVPVDPEELADLLTVVFEGAFVVARTQDEPDAVARQLRHYRTYLELLFDVTP